MPMKRGRGNDSDDDSDSDFEGTNKRSTKKKTREPASKKDDDMDDEDEERLYENEEDKAKLMAMTELEREMILADRAEERDREKQRRAVLKKAEEAVASASKGSRGGRTSRQRQSASAQDSALRQIKAARQRQQQRRKGGDDEEEDEEDEEEDEDEEDEDEDEEDNPRRASRKQTRRSKPPATRSKGALPVEEEEEDEDEERGREPAARAYQADDDDADREEASHDELKSAQVLRSQLEAWYDKPFFTGDGLTGVLVRMAYGQAAQGQSYMVFTVQEIKEGGRPYPFGPKSAMCNKHLVMLDGLGNRHVMAMQNVSNSVFQTEDLERYHRHCERSQRRAMTKREVEAARVKIHTATIYRWDDQHIREVLEKKKAAGQMFVNSAAEKSRLRRLLEDAQSQGLVEEAAGYEHKLREIDDKARAQGAGQRSDGMDNLNKRNKQTNFDMAYKNVSNKPAGNVESKGGVDVFSRRATRPSIYWNTSSKNDKEKEKVASLKSQESAKLSVRQMKMDPADLIKQLHMDIDLGLLPPSISTEDSQWTVKKILGRKWFAGLVDEKGAGEDCKTVTLDEYEREQQQ